MFIFLLLALANFFAVFDASWGKMGISALAWWLETASLAMPEMNGLRLRLARYDTVVGLCVAALIKIVGLA